jgi:hypothetical protein
VSDGPFKYWHPTYDAGPKYEPFDDPQFNPDAAGKQPAFLQRLLGRDPNGADSLPTQEQWDAARALTTYDAPLWDSNVDSPAPRPPAQHPPPNPVRFAGLTSFRNVFEGWVPYYDTAAAPYVYPNLHNRVHAWVSGSMAPFSSPNDPVFFLHHCNVDRLWAEWQRANPTWKYKPDDGEPSPNDPDGENIFPMGQSGAEKIDLRGHHLHDSMPPWDGRSDPEHGGTMPKVSPASVLNHIKLGYTYDTDPPSLTAKSKP